MTLELAADPTAAALIEAVPCLPVPALGTSPALDALRNASAGHGIAVGNDGIMYILRRPWLALDHIIAPALPTHLPYGSIGSPGAELRCGLIPNGLLETVLAHFKAALPNESAAFIIWHEHDRTFSIHYPDVIEATPSRLIYRTPALPHGAHMICDIHSHGNAPAFFSSTDDSDDVHTTKLALVFGSLGKPDQPTVAARLCASGIFLPLPRSPFAGNSNDQ